MPRSVLPEPRVREPPSIGLLGNYRGRVRIAHNGYARREIVQSDFETFPLVRDAAQDPFYVIEFRRSICAAIVVRPIMSASRDFALTSF